MFLLPFPPVAGGYPSDWLTSHDRAVRYFVIFSQWVAECATFPSLSTHFKTSPHRQVLTMGGRPNPARHARTARLTTIPSQLRLSPEAPHAAPVRVREARRAHHHRGAVLWHSQQVYSAERDPADDDVGHKRDHSPPPDTGHDLAGSGRGAVWVKSSFFLCFFFFKLVSSCDTFI